MRPRMAFSAVVLPAPLGPMSPRMRPSSTRKSTPSSPIVAPKALRRPCASMHAISALLFLSVILIAWGGLAPGAGRQQFFWIQAKALNGGVDPGPFFTEKLLPFALQQ